MKRILQTIILLTSLTCFSQSKSNNIDLIGTWKYYFGYFEYKLTLNQDSTYKYQVVGDLTNRKSEGVWKLENKKLILNSYKQYPTETIIHAKYNDSIKGINFSIRTETGQPVCMPHIRIKNSLTEIDTLVENQCEFFEFKNIFSIQEFTISFVGLKDATWSGKMNKNYFEIIMAEELDNYIYQTNETWKIKGDKLYSPTSKKDNTYFINKDRINYYLKEKTNANTR
jgi:hypothetical protein